ncbi:MAG TPA: hypothetical protein VMF13_19150, partial [Luteitalea sp.]|nr:hypothetical protein [Luteitalea sp.]
IGRSWNWAGSLNKNFRGGFLKTAYSYGDSKNTIDPGSIAAGSWTGNQIAGDPNNPMLARSTAGYLGHRFILAGSYTANYFKFGGTTASFFWESRTIGNTSYTFAGDANGDAATNNDLIYIPRDQSEMNFQQFTASGVTFTPAQQAAAWDAYINQDEYLSKRRGEYAERGQVVLPMVHRMDVSLQQDFYAPIKGRRHNFQVRVDFLNFGNLLNSDWGVGTRMVSNQPLTTPSADAQGRLQYRMRNFGSALMSQTFEPTATLGDVYRFQVMLRYLF